MKKGKEWLKKETEKLYKHDEAYLNPDDIVVENYQTVTSILELIDQLDEPEKVVVPQFVGDWFEENKEYLETSVYGLCLDVHVGLQNEMTNWVNYSENKPIETIFRMKDGYAIEKPKLLTVIVKDYDKTIMSKQLPEDEVNKMMEGLEK